MKNIKIFLLVSLVFMAAGCEEYLDINKDPNNPSDPNIQQLLPGIQVRIGDALSYDFGAVGYATASFTHQLSTRQPEYDNYGITGSAFAVTNYWSEFYAGILNDIQLLINLGEESDNSYYAGIGKVLKAYTFSVMVDLWGDIPYSEALDIANTNPIFDNDEAIYSDLLSTLDAAIADLTNEASENLRLPGDDDIMYNGNISDWIKATNSIKLKLLTQVQNTSLYNQSEVDALLSGDLISSWDESFMVPYGPSTTPDDRNPAFVAEYGGGQISNYINPWMYRIMNGQNDNIFTGLYDPRIPYYFVNQITDGATENPPEYQDGNFVSIWFGSTGLNRDHAGRATFTMMGIYPCGGKYDDGTGSPSTGGLTVTDGTGAAPVRLLTYADMLYLKAELIANGRASGDLRVTFEEALYESMVQVDGVVEMVSPSQSVPVLVGSDAYTEYMEGVLAEFDAATSEQKLEIIMTQKWLSSFGTSHDQYTDYRRTGYPILFDPENESMAPNGFVTGGPDGSGPVPVQRTREYPLSWPYDNDELTLNTNAPEQKTVSTDGVFWDN